MFKKILIANRGEIALRIIRACKELGITTVAIYSEADSNSLHVRFADEDVCIGPGAPGESYLDAKRVIAAAEVTNADAIHPGYGFLAENADFAEVCQSCNIAFIGPPPKVIQSLGDKSFAKQTMQNAGVPVIPGSEGIISDYQQALEIVKSIDYPIIIKASAGGGGRGMRLVTKPEDLKTSFDAARTEASIAFGNPAVYIEKFITNPRHIEIQLLADNYGNVVHLGERDCTIQRRHQKLIEESPSIAVDPALRIKMGKAAVDGAKAAGYSSAGTVEFLLDSDGSFYFMEVNTRIQVEHTISEEITNVDLVKEQIELAAGKELPFSQSDIQFSGHAIECRINAEDTEKKFRPTPGEITTFHTPGGLGVRVDTHAYAGYHMPPNYDSLIAKLIVHGKDRSEALLRMRRALDEFIVEGVPTPIEFYKTIFEDPIFIFGNYDTSYVERFMAGPQKTNSAKHEEVT
ncbi:MAG: acetyl-CoA carboxylase biotin carboxylase subunit [candidate division Zixibacteria bacterium]|nr:acetyl-CoA carboxylase biotin carboxylase subunit [candidate division Zixibacteria bacterium]